MKEPKFLLAMLALPIFQLGAALPVSAADYAVADIALTPGSNASELNLAWTTKDFGTGDCAVQIALEGQEFKASDQFSGTKAKTSSNQGSYDKTDYSYCEVTVSGLKSEQEYTYRLGDNNNKWSDTFQYSTENESKYGFVYLADVQIGASMGRRPTEEKIAAAVVNDSKAWADNLGMIIDKFPESAFILSAGDQIETPGSEAQWSGFFSPQELTSIPLAPTAAAHEQMGSGRGGAVTSYALDYHFNLPNESEHPVISGDINECPPPGAPVPPDAPACTPEYEDRTAAAGDYYFTYGDALYIVLNMDSVDYEMHDAFIQSAVKANPDAKWKLAMWHYTIYTAATRHPFVDRTIMATMMEENGIDLALQGHDHTYCRTYPMLKDVAQTDAINSQGESVDATGVVYFTANSASGSKYYTLSPEADSLYYVAASNQEKVPTFSYIDVDTNSLKVTTYKTPSMEMIDSYTMIKTGK